MEWIEYRKEYRRWIGMEFVRLLFTYYSVMTDRMDRKIKYKINEYIICMLKKATKTRKKARERRKSMSNMESILDGFTWWLLDIGDHFSAFLQYCVISLQMMHNMQSRPMLEEPCNTVPIEGWSSKNVLLIITLISVFLQLECIRCADKWSSQQMLLEDASLNTECSSCHTNTRTILL